MARKCLSTKPAVSRLPMSKSQSTKPVPLIGCMNVAESIQMNCIAKPMRAEKTEMTRSLPPAFHCCQAATSRARPATANPVFPANHRKRLIVSAAVLGSSRVGSVTAGAAIARAAAEMPETAVNAAERAKRIGTRGLPQPSRMIQVLERCQAPAMSVIADTSRATPPAP